MIMPPNSNVKFWQILPAMQNHMLLPSNMRHRICAIICIHVLICLAGTGCARKIPQYSGPAAQQAPLPDLAASYINIPVQIDLKPIYAMAERSVDTVFTSPGYPGQWIEADCATRYQYRFRRSPLRFAAAGTQVQLSFTGWYQIMGATRACAGTTVLSPWTPACRCGFEEGERNVDIQFAASFTLLPNHRLATKITRQEPRPGNKCTVCFWGQDITKVVMNGLKAELDLSKKAMEDSFGTTNLKPFLQMAWNQLSAIWTLPDLGYLSLGPSRLHMEKINVQNNLLHLNLGITATPRISFIKPETIPQVVPDLTPSGNTQGFNIHLEAALQYDSLSNVLNSYLSGKRFDLADGIFKKHIIVRNCKLYSDLYDKLVVELAFEGSHSGTAYFTGKPVYNPENKKIEIRDLSYDLKTNDFLLRTARWLFDKRIVSEINKYTSIDLAGYYDTASRTMNSWLNREWTRGIHSSGSVSELRLTGVFALREHLLVRSNCNGYLKLAVSEAAFPF